MNIDRSAGDSSTAYPELFIKETPPAPEECGPKVHRYTDLFYKSEHEANVRLGDHPRIVRYYGWDKRGLLFQKHSAGDLLCHLLTQRDPPPSLPARLQWASDIAEGLAFIHSRGVIWVDVSLRNVLLSDDLQHASLCDFGGSCILPVPGQKSLPAAFKGPMVAISPAVCMPPYGRAFDWKGPGSDSDPDVTPHHDRFGYAILLFSLLTFRFPHSKWLVERDEVRINEIGRLQHQGEFDTMREPEYAAFDRIIQKCFRAEYESSEDLENEVKDACEAMNKDPTLLKAAAERQAGVQDPIVELHYTAGRNLFPFSDIAFEDLLDSDPDYDSDSEDI
ncbi:kinase-like domain-containing protein [Mycena galericulata]|nr:kinase-like domain-containing protein [Mycena galericulata]